MKKKILAFGLISALFCSTPAMADMNRTTKGALLGAGFAGLLLLSRFQPDRIKISQELITNVHKSGPRQAIIQAIIKCCTSLEIQVSAMGVATPEEWMWLESAGIEMFQGDLFAKAKLNGIPSVAWPEKK
ncbi:TPA: hypothetical protein GFY00_09490 [Escherichia coli]|nr:hypothetical protein [Escherichia coli]